MNHHPERKIVEQYTRGDLQGPLASMISAHLELCSDCQFQYKKILNESAEEFKAQKVNVPASEMESAFNLLMNKIDKNSSSQKGNEEEQVVIKVSGETFVLPKAMGFLKDQIIPWKEFGLKNAIAPVVTSKEGNFYLIYIGPGESVPEHSHSDFEYSYVAAGSYEDGYSRFETGDFSVNPKQHSHSPKATSDDGCLVLSWVDGRLNFFKGLLSPLNSLLWWYLHRA